MVDDIRAAFAFLTIFPVGQPSRRKPGWSFAWYPLVGAVIGAILVMLASILPFNSELKAFLVLLCWAVITGGLHLDAFGDSCDGLLVSATAGDRLRIMKDPRSGSWAVIGLILLLLGKWLAIQAVPVEWLLLPPIFGRWALVMAAYHFPYARESGTGAFFRDGLDARQLLVASAIVLIVVAHADAVILWLLTLAVTIGIGRWAKGRLGGGITGDVYGAICELTELACLLAIGILHG